jgi:hypothetical protein
LIKNTKIEKNSKPRAVTQPFIASMERAVGKMERAEEPIFDPPITISVLGKNLPGQDDVQIYLAVHNGHTPEDKLTEGRELRVFRCANLEMVSKQKNLYKVNLYRLWSKKLF